MFSEILEGNSGNSQTTVENVLGPSDGDYVFLGAPGALQPGLNTLIVGGGVSLL